MTQAKPEIHIDRLLRSKRRTISLEINRDGSLTVRAPKHASLDEIFALVNSKHSWITKKQNLAYERAREAPAKKFVNGELFLFMGDLYPLEMVQNLTKPLQLDGKFLMAVESQDNARAIFEKWYRKQAAQVIKPRTAELAAEYGFNFTMLRITGAKTRWGSCGPTGSLNFSWRLVMAPSEVIDYVIVHELVHLRIRNHSKHYWKSVREILPDYQDRLNWLDENGHHLNLD